MSTDLNKKKKLTRRNLIDYFYNGCKPESDFRIGVEWEKIGVYKDSGKAISYFGPAGVETIFKALSQKYGWQPQISGGHIISLHKGDAAITLEPGGQIELSGEKALFLNQNADEYKKHIEELKEVSEPLGIVWLGIGLQPISPLEDIEWVPKKRYEIMRESLRGGMTHNMMKQTASIQISLDYENERDAIKKLRLAQGLGPIFNAMFANSPLQNGAVNGYMSMRAHIWKHTAPERSGLIPGVFNESFGFEKYVDYALSVPLLFILRNDRWVATKGLDFQTFMEKGFDGIEATIEDWHLHLTTIFTDSRLKNYLEIRSFDCQKMELGFAAPALVTGLFYDKVASEAAWEFVAELTLGERVELAAEAAKKGLHAELRKESLFQIASKLIYIADEGLKRRVAKGLANENAFMYLKPIKALVNKGQMPADILLGCFDYSLTGQEKAQRIISCAAI